MVTIENKKLDSNALQKIQNCIAENDKIIGERFKRYTVIALFLIEIPIFYLIYLSENYSFSIIFYLIFIVPIWSISMIIFRYFQKRNPAKRLQRFCKTLLKSGEHELIRVRPTQCDKYSIGLNEYYLFESINCNVYLLLKLNDFTVNPNRFPSDDFYIIPQYLFDFTGNEISSQGQTIKTNIDGKRIKKYLPAFENLHTGEVIMLNKK